MTMDITTGTHPPPTTTTITATPTTMTGGTAAC